MGSENENNLSEMNGLDAEVVPAGFRPDEMAACPACGRANGPNRARCLYCGAELPVRERGEVSLKVSFRPLEAWEKGWNVVLVSADANSLGTIADVLPFDVAELAEAVAGGLILPIARVSTAAEAEAIAARAGEGAARVLGDEELNAESAPVRLRSLEMDDGKLIAVLFNGDEVVEADADDVRLIVAGRIVSSIADTVETKKARKPGKTEAIESTAEEFVIDIFAGDAAAGWRVSGRGFDFSCLGEEKTLAVGENARRLVDRLEGFCVNARVDRNYEKAREMLDVVWPPETERSAAGFSRKGFGGIEVTKRMVYDRARQFTKYSRMLRLLI